MPLYDYKCREHGLFHELATMAESGDPKACPHCGTLSARVIVVPPVLRELAASMREALDRNERSRHQPVLSTPEYRKEMLARHEHRHGKGCGCADKPLNKPQVFFTADGNKTFPAARPWMISH